MPHAEPMNWVVAPQHEDHDSPYFYGCRQTSNFRLFIASGCCAALIQRVEAEPLPYESACIKCDRRFPISPYDGFNGEDEPFQLWWGQFPWDEVEERMLSWLDFYFNLDNNKEKEVAIRFDGLTAEEQYDR